MPYKTIKDLPSSVKDNLPKRAKEIFLEAFNHAFEQYKGDEVIAFKVAWSAVKKKYVKEDGKWGRLK